MQKMKQNKRKAFSDAEKASLLAAYQGSGKTKIYWCKENGIGLSTLQRWLRQNKSQTQIQPPQNWVSVTPTVSEKSKAFEIQIGKCVIAIDHQTDLVFLASILKVLVEVC